MLSSGMLTMGPKVAELEDELARACAVEHALVVSSGTAALHLAVLALGLEPGDEVLVPAYTFPATAKRRRARGAAARARRRRPGDDEHRPGADRGRAADEGRARGAPVRTARASRGAARRAAGARGRRRRARGASGAGARAEGSGSLGCLSFHPRKIVTTGEGGAVTTNDAGIAEAVAAGRNHGWRSLVPPDLPAPGLNYRLSDILCAVGLPQIRRLAELLAERTRIADGYTERLRDLPVLLPHADDGDVHGWQAYVIQVDDRDRVLRELRAQGIEAQIGTYALQLLGAYRDQGRIPGCRARLRARARAAVPHAALRQRPRPGRGGS